MKKTHIIPLQEILASHIIEVQNHIEESFAVFIDDMMQISSGVITGLIPSSGTLTTVNLAAGSIHQDRVFGELELATGIVFSAPVTGTRTDLLVASYSEILDTLASGYVLLDIITGEETVQDNYSRKFGSINLEVLQNTTYLTRPANKIPICEVNLNTLGITSITDVRIFARITRLQEDIQQNFVNMFFSGF